MNTPQDPPFGVATGEWAAADVESYDRAVATLSLDGEVVGHLACSVLRMVFPASEPWLWFVVCWRDGIRDASFEDYGPDWPVLRELAAGRFVYARPAPVRERRLLWLRWYERDHGADAEYEVSWLSRDDAAQQWRALALTPDDF